MRVRNDRVGVLALALIVPVLGCAKKAEHATAPNIDAGGDAGTPGDSDDPLAQLAALENRMRAHGLPVASDKQQPPQPAGETEKDDMDAAAEMDAATEQTAAEEPPAPAGAQTQPPRRDRSEVCGDLCSLSESICTLEVRICSLAEDHGNDAVYADACERAVEDCEVAGEACDSCG
jgi:hypothetical protein